MSTNASIEKLAQKIDSDGRWTVKTNMRQRKKGRSKIEPTTETPPELKVMDVVKDEVIDEVKGAIAHSGIIMPSAGLNLLFTAPSAEKTLNAVSKKKKWICVPVAADTGAMVNVTPPQIFPMEIEETVESKRGECFFGAAGPPIKNIGRQNVGGKVSWDSDSKAISMAFEVANISRPLASVSKICKKGYQAVFDDEESYLLHKATNQKIKLREENVMYYLDIWVEVPVDFEINPGFAGQVRS